MKQINILLFNSNIISKLQQKCNPAKTWIWPYFRRRILNTRIQNLLQNQNLPISTVFLVAKADITYGLWPS